MPSAEVEPPLSASDFAPRPPPLECKPLPAEVQRRLACGEGLLAALAAYPRHSQLAWWQQQAEHERQRAERGQQAAAQPVPQQQEKQQQVSPPCIPKHPPSCVPLALTTLPHRPLGALLYCPVLLLALQEERPAQAVEPGAVHAAPAGEDAASDSPCGAASEPPPRPCSRASAAPAQVMATPLPCLPAWALHMAMLDSCWSVNLARRAHRSFPGQMDVIAQPPQDEVPPEPDAGQPGAAKEDAGLAGFSGAECGGGDVDMLDAGEGSQTLAPPPPPPAAPEGAAAAELAKAATQPRAAGQPERAAATRRQAARQAQAGAEGLPAAAAPIGSPAAQPLAVSGAALAACTPVAAGKAQGGAAAAAVATAVAEEPASEAEEQEGEGGSEGGRGRKRPLSAQEAATEAALQKIGQASWEALCEELRQRAQQAGEAGGRGGRGRGRRGGRKGGRKGGRGGAAAQQAVRLTDVLNPNSAAYHAEFAAAYQKARDELAK